MKNKVPLQGAQPQSRLPHPSSLSPTLQSEAVAMMDQIVHWVLEDRSGLGRPQMAGAPASEPLAVPMILLGLVLQFGEADEELAGRYSELGDWCARRILQHVQVRTGSGTGSGVYLSSMGFPVSLALGVLATEGWAGCAGDCVGGWPGAPRLPGKTSEPR